MFRTRPVRTNHRFLHQEKQTEEKKIMEQGTIVRLTDRGFGFIDTGTGTDMFFHMSNVAGRYEDLRVGQKVTFSVGQGPKGPRAENVQPG
jgi:CspA family cold shock protein